MLKISQVFISKFIFFALLIVTILLVGFFISKEGMWSFSSLWILFISIIIFILLALLYLYKTIIQKLVDDIQSLSNYVDAINNKEYETALHVENYSEILYISIQLKNLVKRLNNRDKKRK